MLHSPSYQDLEFLQEMIGVRFQNRELLCEALTHRSYLDQLPEGSNSNSRLEHFGDSILSYIVNCMIDEKYPRASARVRDVWRQEITCNNTLSRVALGLNLASLLYADDSKKDSTPWTGRGADALEALIAAVHKDQGLETTRSLVLDLLHDEIESVVSLPDPRDAMDALRAFVTEEFGGAQIRLSQLEARRKETYVGLWLNDDRICVGRGPNERSAQDHAAWRALCILKRKVAGRLAREENDAIEEERQVAEILGSLWNPHPTE